MVVERYKESEDFVVATLELKNSEIFVFLQVIVDDINVVDP